MSIVSDFVRAMHARYDVESIHKNTPSSYPSLTTLKNFVNENMDLLAQNTFSTALQWACLLKQDAQQFTETQSNLIAYRQTLRNSSVQLKRILTEFGRQYGVAVLEVGNLSFE